MLLAGYTCARLPLLASPATRHVQSSVSGMAQCQVITP